MQKQLNGTAHLTFHEATRICGLGLGKQICIYLTVAQGQCTCVKNNSESFVRYNKWKRGEVVGVEAKEGCTVGSAVVQEDAPAWPTKPAVDRMGYKTR